MKSLFFNRLVDRTNWRNYYGKIKSCIQEYWVEKLQSATIRTNVFTSTLRVKDGLYMNNFKNEFIQPGKLTNTQLQWYLMDVHTPKCETKWEAYLNETFNWTNIWKLSLDLSGSNKEKQFHCKVIHSAPSTESR